MTTRSVMFIAFFSLSTALHAQTKLLQGDGLAAKYPGDSGIAKDKAVIFAEDFETVTLAEISKRWTETSNKNDKVLSLAEDNAPGAHGKRSMLMTAVTSENTGGHLYKKLPREVDTAFVRFYVKFPKDAGTIHHFAHLGGYRPATNWPQGGAGSRPRGDERMTVGIEPVTSRGLEQPGQWNFYPYWHEMKASVGNRYWGNSIAPARPLLVPRDTWQCVEVMMKCNSVIDGSPKRDGELALWLDGKLAMHVAPGTPRGDWTGMGFQLKDAGGGGVPFEGFSWRTTDKLKINFFWLMHYVTPDAYNRTGTKEPQGGTRVWFDNIVVAEEYVGPVAKREVGNAE